MLKLFISVTKMADMDTTGGNYSEKVKKEPEQ